MLNIDKEAIKKKVHSRTYRLNIQEQWLTPAGNPRSAPIYEAMLENNYLKKTKRIKKKTVHEVKVAAQKVLGQWEDQEIRKRVKEAKKDAKEKAEAEWIEKKENLADYIEELNNILVATIDFDDRIEWEELLDHTEYHEFKFDAPKPESPSLQQKPSSPFGSENPDLPNKTIWDKIFPFLYEKKVTAFQQKKV